MERSLRRVIVCGGGLSGLAAAVTAAQAGAKVVLLEKAPSLGGTTVLSSGSVWTFTDYEAVREHIPDGDPALQWLVCETFDESRAWLESLGVKFKDIGRLAIHGHGHSIVPDEAIAILASRLLSLGGEIALQTALHSLLTHAGIVKGVRALHDGRMLERQADAVVLATGGFQGNPELIGRYIVSNPDNLLLRANPWSMGDGFLAATEIGAASSPGLDTFYGHALAAPPARLTFSRLSEATQFQGPLSVALNMQGLRFADESEGIGEEVLNQQLAQQPGGRGVYIVDDELMGQPPLAQGRGPLIRVIVDRARSIGAVVVEGRTLRELCKGLAEHGIPETRALATLTQFNDAMESGRTDELAPARKRFRRPLSKGPFYAVFVKAGITFTMGGLAIDEQARVLARAGGSSPYAPVPIERAYVDGSTAASTSVGEHYRQTPIPGLYAAGCDVGNISHSAYMGGLSAALCVGRVAGRNAALQSNYSGAK
ncbi:FAD-dependent oxidoreductase [Candidimonas nitroreducens]|nr:FAD-dependent oxidoreductase [Candidimonas nitroreducens]